MTLLATEILLLILDQLHLTPIESVVTALAISSISRRWRSAALSTPSLWSTFSISLRTRHKDFLPTFLHRSASAPLDITVTFDFSHADRSAKSKVQKSTALLVPHADRLHRLHLRFVAYMDLEHDIIAMLRIKSSSLRYLEMESLQNNSHRLELHDLLPLGYNDIRLQCWSDRCPALTHITSTHPELLLYSPTKITYLCIKWVIGGSEFTNASELYILLQTTTNLVELILDGISLTHDIDIISLPHLRSLSLRSTPKPDGSISPYDASTMAAFVLSLHVPTLSSLAVPEPNTAIPKALESSAVTLLGVTRLAIVPFADPALWLRYSTALPAVEELVLLGADLHALAGLSCDAWPNLRTIGIAELERPSPQRLQAKLRSIHAYANRRLDAGHESTLSVRLPGGVMQTCS